MRNVYKYGTILAGLAAYALFTYMVIWQMVDAEGRPETAVGWFAFSFGAVALVCWFQWQMSKESQS